jgi:hypothetical protein
MIYPHSTIATDATGATFLRLFCEKEGQKVALQSKCIEHIP